MADPQNLHRLGVMQGRILPSSLGRLQVFPLKSWREEVPQAAKIGFSHLEWLDDKEGFGRRILGQLDPRDLEAAKQQISIASICSDYSCSGSLLNSTDEFLEDLSTLIQIAERTAIRMIVLPFFENNSIKNLKQLKDALSIIDASGIDDLAFRGNIKIALETDLPANAIAEGLTGQPLNACGCCYDLGNAAAQGFNPSSEIEELGNLIFHVHIKDRPKGGPNTMLGNGDVDFDDCLGTLSTIGYTGPLIFETRYFKQPIEEMILNFKFIEAIVQKANQ